MWVTGEYYDALRDARTAARGRLDAASRTDPFERIDWFARIWSHDPPGPRPLIVRARAGASELWLFLARTGPDRLTALASPRTLRFSPIFIGDPDEVERETLIRAAARRLRTLGITRIALTSMLSEHAAMIRRSFTRSGWVARERAGPANFMLAVADVGFDEYWDHRSDRLHDQVAAGSRHLLVEIADRMTPRLWREAELIGGPDTFLQALAGDASSDGTLRFGIVRVGDAPVGAQLWTVHDGRATCHWRVEDPQAAYLHPTVQLTASMLRYLINVDHARLIELGNGRAADLDDWASDRRPLRRLDLFDPRAPSAWLPAMAAATAALVRRQPLD